VAGWFALGPLWAIAGVLAVPRVAIIGSAVVLAFTEPDPDSHLRDHEPYRALTDAKRQLPAWRPLARRWPGQFSEPLARVLLTQAETLCALHRETAALAPAAEAVEIYQALAARKPSKFTHGLANALDRQARVLAAGDRVAEAVEAMTIAIRLYHGLPPAAARDHVPNLAEAVAHQAGWMSDLGLEELPSDPPGPDRFTLVGSTAPADRRPLAPPGAFLTVIYKAIRRPLHRVGLMAMSATPSTATTDLSSTPSTAPRGT
jgi:hypothetical protein